MVDDLDDPARLLNIERSVVRAAIGAGAELGVGGEVFQQAEALFGEQEVPRAEFASWLHFAATVLGHDGYARRIEATEPGMPWRAVWAWWRPVGQCVAHPNLGGYRSVKRHTYEGRGIIRVKDHWEDTWLDLETGRPLPPPVEGSAVPVECPRPWHTDKDVDHFHDRQLFAPESWAEAEPLAGEDGRTRYLVNEVHGIALLDTDPAVLRDWPRGRMDHTSAEGGSPGQSPVYEDPDGPLTAAWLDETFAAVSVTRIPESKLPSTLEHTASRAHLRDIGLPTWWACAWTTFAPHPADQITPLSDADAHGAEMPDGTDATDLLAFGTSEHGDLYLHRRDGTVHILTPVLEDEKWAMVLLAPDLDFFTRCLEGVVRYMNASWHPYPDEEGMGQVFVMQMDGFAPSLELLDPDSPSGSVWGYFLAGITELDEDGF
ncbi:SUKH-4 family immunity protein [Streptomyces sp. 205]|uniref:SUKH-4 family immunity protein n=2 Tax=Streptomyces coffeae TaxID=621382 RepID=A0ABS1NEZ8_9ACTN|nr:SUKH-4 family immunity protein [Streptomyces coffeae]